MERLVKGFLKFRTEVFGKKKELFTRLSENQAPRALFITCSDSRVDPTLLTQTDPGELLFSGMPAIWYRPMARCKAAARRPSNTRWPY